MEIGFAAVVGVVAFSVVMGFWWMCNPPMRKGKKVRNSEGREIQLYR